MACTERHARRQDEECAQARAQEGRGSLKEALDQLHGATRLIGAVHEWLGACELARDPPQHFEGVPSRGMVDAVKADLDAHVRKLDLMQSQHDSAFRSALERWSEQSEGADSSSDTWRSIEERFGQLHAEHLRQVRALYSEQAQRLMQLLPALCGADSAEDWEALEESPQGGESRHEPQTNERESVTSSDAGGGGSRKNSLRQSIASRSSVRQSIASRASIVWRAAKKRDEVDSLTATRSSRAISRLLVRISTISGVASLAARRSDGDDVHSVSASRTLDQARSMYNTKPKSSSAHPRLEMFSGALILLNIVWMAIDVDLGIRSVRTGAETPEWIGIGDMVFVVLFTVELLARLVVSGREFFDSKQLLWSLLAVSVTAVDIADVAMRLDSSSFLKSLRVLRLVRTLRLLRAIRNVRHLRIMAAAIFCSLPSLSWALVLLGMLMLVVALFLMQTLETHFRTNPHEKPDPQVIKYFGSLPRSMLSILMAITGGVDWETLLEVLEPISPMYAPIFSLFIAFMTVGVLNILTAVFVESINKISEVDADLAVIEQVNEDAHQYNRMRDFFKEADDDDDGMLSKADFDRKMEDPSCQAQLRTLDLNMWSVRGLFHLLAFQGGCVEIEELVYGLMRLKGSAKAVDMAILLFESKRNQAVMSKLASTMDSISDRLNLLESQPGGFDWPPRAGPHEVARAKRTSSALERRTLQARASSMSRAGSASDSLGRWDRSSFI